MKVSVIIPAYNASTTLPLCLKAVFSERNADTEILVIDDCSIDNSRQIARDAGATVYQTQHRTGPAAARNLGAARASGDILFFVDSDVVIAKGSLARVKEVFDTEPQIGAVFGSYDDHPAEENFLSQYKNMLHHFVHQESSSNAGTFWAGCGAIRKEIFELVNGFDADQYPYPSIEDIELGIRIVEKSQGIRLDKQLQGKHLKRWTLGSMLKADILHRAYPWSRLIALRGSLPAELNLKIYHRISGALATLLLILCCLLIFKPSLMLLGTIAGCMAGIIFLNRNIYLFFLNKKGPLFLTGVIFWHTLYYLYSTITFGYCWIRFRLLTRNPFATGRLHPSQS